MTDDEWCSPPWTKDKRVPFPVTVYLLPMLFRRPTTGQVRGKAVKPLHRADPHKNLISLPTVTFFSGSKCSNLFSFPPLFLLLLLSQLNENIEINWAKCQQHFLPSEETVQSRKEENPLTSTTRIARQTWRKQKPVPTAVYRAVVPHGHIFGDIWNNIIIHFLSRAGRRSLGLRKA